MLFCRSGQRACLSLSSFSHPRGRNGQVLKLSTASVSFSTTRQHRIPEDYSHSQEDLLSRRLPLLYDYAVPTPSHLLGVALDAFLPGTPDNGNTASSRSPKILPSIQTNPLALPPAQHLVYFPPPIGSRDLLSDGTDPLQSPGPPFIRRMWAGGSVSFNNKKPLKLDGSRIACLESLRTVDVKGKPGEEKVFVGIERRVGPCADSESEDVTRERLWREEEGELGEIVGILERRNIVFLKERSKEQAIKDIQAARTKQMAPPGSADGVPVDFEHVVTPDSKLLFRYSALTYNAHAIHLDPEYCREVEGHRGLLVHGPLSFTLMVTLLERKLAEDVKFGKLKSIEYRNLSPLYCGEGIRFAGRRTAEDRWEIWAETPEGGLAVKGTARTELA